MFLRPSRQVRQLLPVAKESGKVVLKVCVQARYHDAEPEEEPRAIRTRLSLAQAGQGEPCLLLFFLSTPGRFLKMPCRASSWEFFFIRRAPAASESVLRNAGHRIFPAAEYAHGRRCAFSAWEHFNEEF